MSQWTLVANSRSEKAIYQILLMGNQHTLDNNSINEEEKTPQNIARMKKMLPLQQQTIRDIRKEEKNNIRRREMWVDRYREERTATTTTTTDLIHWTFILHCFIRISRWPRTS